MVYLVEDDQGATCFSFVPVQGWLIRHLRVGDGDSHVLGSMPSVTVLEVRVDGKTHSGGGVGPLAFEVFGGHHKVDPGHFA